MDRCPNCMRIMEEGSCPSCGANQINTAVNVRGALSCHTLLEKRYEIGNPLGSNAQAIAYIAFDNQRQEPVIVLEFFPARIVNRSEQLVVMRGRSDLYADACRRFLTSSMAQPLPLIDTFCANNTGYRVYKPKSGMYSVEAELLLDEPILFRNEMDQPIMSINALHIPPMPKQREWTLSRRLTRMKKRRMTRRIIAGATAVLVLGMAGAVVWDMMREYDVTVRVHTEVPVLKASVGDLELPKATPDAEHIVTYQTKLRKGSYTFTAENEHQLSSGKTTINVNGPTTRNVSIPLPSPTPITLTGNKGIYQEDNQCYVITDTFKETNSQLNPATKLHQVHLFANDVLADNNTSYKILLYRDGASRVLTWKNGTIDFAVTAGSYELKLSMGDQLLPLCELKITEDREVFVDLEALAFYCNNVKTLKEEKQLCYIAGDSSRMISADAEQLNKWYNLYPELFEDYRQYPISIQVDEHLRKDVSFTLNGRSWMPGQTVSVNAAVEELVFAMTADGATHEETKTIHPDDSEQIITIGENLIAEAARWKDVKGLVSVGGETYLLRDGKDFEPADAKMRDQLDKVLKLTDNLLEHDLSKRVNVFAEQNRFVRPDVVKAVKVNGIPMQLEENKYSATLTPGEYEFVVCFSDGTEEIACTKKITDEQSFSFKLLKNETEKARKVNIKLKSSNVNAIIQTSGGYFLLPAENAKKLEDVSAEEVREFAATFTSSVFDDQWDLWPTEVSIDERVNPAAITSILMEGQLLLREPEATLGDGASIPMGSQPAPEATPGDGASILMGSQPAPEATSGAIASILMGSQPAPEATSGAIASIMMGGQSAPKATPGDDAQVLRATMIDLQAATEGTHHIAVKLNDGTEDGTEVGHELHVAAPSEDNPEDLNQLILLKEWVDTNMAKLAFWGADQNDLKPIASEDEKIISMLTKNALRDYWHGETIHRLQIKVEFEKRDDLSWKLLHVQSGEKLPLDIASEEFTLWLSAGEYELYAVYEEKEHLYEKVDMNQDKELTLVEEKLLKAIPVLPTAAPTATLTAVPPATSTDISTDVATVISLSDKQ